MLPKQYRLPANVRLKNPSSLSTPNFLLKVSKNDSPSSRFGFVVRKAVDKRATVRNRIRRLFRSCIEEMREEIHPGSDMLFLLRIGILEKQREALYNELHSFLQDKKLLV